MPVTLPQYKPQQLAKLSREELQSHLEVLQRQHAEVNTQRDELLRDVELLCQGMPSATFDPSSLLQERVRNAETELSRTKAKLRAVTSDLSDVTDDHAQMKEAKRISDRSAREATLRVMSLEKELSFYQGQAMEAMRARDSATADADQLRTAHVALQRDSDETQVQLNHLRQCNSSLEGRVEQLGAELQAAQKQAHKVPGLQKELSASKAHAEQLAAKLADAQAAHGSAQQQLHISREQAKALQEQLTVKQTHVAELTQQVESSAQEARQEGLALQQSMQAQLSNAQTQVEELQQQLANEHSTTAELRSQLDDLSGELDGTKQALQEAQATLDELQGRLQEVTGEKTSLLVEVADLKEQLRNGSALDRDIDNDSWGAWPWQTDTRRMPGHSNNGRKSVGGQSGTSQASPSQQTGRKQKPKR